MVHWSQFSRRISAAWPHFGHCRRRGAASAPPAGSGGRLTTRAPASARCGECFGGRKPISIMCCSITSPIAAHLEFQAAQARARDAVHAAFDGDGIAAVLIGERPGLTSPDSLGVYVTWQPAPGAVDAARNCLSNIRPEGLPIPEAANALVRLIEAARRHRMTGIRLSRRLALPSGRG